MIRSDLYINGQWVATPKRHPVFDPSDNSVITEIAVAGDSEVDAALDAKNVFRIANYIRYVFLVIFLRKSPFVWLIVCICRGIFDFSATVLVAIDFNVL